MSRSGKKLIGLAHRATDFIETSNSSYKQMAISFLGIIIIRLAIENWLSGFENKSGLFIFYEFTHTLFFFMLAYLVFLGIFVGIMKIEGKKAANVALWGMMVLIFPPIIDYIISAGSGYWSFYEFDGLRGLFVQYYSFFDDTPNVGVTYGVRISIVFSLGFLFVYSYLKTKSLKKILGLMVVFYSALFFLGTMPSWITILVKGSTKGFLSIQAVDSAQFLLSPARIYFREINDYISALNIKMSIIYAPTLILIGLISMLSSFPKTTISFLKNTRPLQIFFHTGLVLIGVFMGTYIFQDQIVVGFFEIASIVVLLLAVCFAWLASVVVNDLFDDRIDNKTNRLRPMVLKSIDRDSYRAIGIFLFLASILYAAIVSFKSAAFLLIYQAFAWVYSAWPLRLKRFAVISTFIGSLASLMVLFSGFVLVSPDQSVEKIPSSIVVLLIIGYTLSLGIKDFKDIEGDKADGVYTLPVLLGEEWARILTGGGIFISYILSIVFLNESRLFWWAFLFGGISFWIVISKKINPRHILWWILGAVFIYGLILVKTVLY